MRLDKNERPILSMVVMGVASTVYVLATIAITVGACWLDYWVTGTASAAILVILMAGFMTIPIDNVWSRIYPLFDQGSATIGAIAKITDRQVFATLLRIGSTACIAEALCATARALTPNGDEQGMVGLAACAVVWFGGRYLMSIGANIFAKPATGSSLERGQPLRTLADAQAELDELIEKDKKVGSGGGRP